jgi:hypothetical protein
MESNSSTATGSAEAPAAPGRRSLFGAASNLVFAGIGITGVLADEAGALYRRSVERGQDHVRRAQERLEQARAARRSARSERRRRRHGKRGSEELEAVLARLNVPTTADLNALTQQISELEAKLDQLADN